MIAVANDRQANCSKNVQLMNKTATVGTALLCVALAAGAGFWFGAQRANAPGDVPTAAAATKGTAPVGTPMVVEATKVVRQPLPQTITAVGSLRSDESVTLRPEVAGRVNAILFKEGQNVSKGMLWLTGGTLNIYSQVGLVTLVGLITKHGILIVEFSNQLRAKGEDLMDAVADAATLRLRPILMTTGAMVLGALPLALAHGAGAESRTQIGWVIVGGMTFGTLLTLFVVPTAYTLLAGRAVHHEPASAPAPAAPLPGAPVSGHAD